MPRLTLPPSGHVCAVCDAPLGTPRAMRATCPAPRPGTRSLCESIYRARIARTCRRVLRTMNRRAA